MATAIETGKFIIITLVKTFIDFIIALVHLFGCGDGLGVMLKRLEDSFQQRRRLLFNRVYNVEIDEQKQSQVIVIKYKDEDRERNGVKNDQQGIMVDNNLEAIGMEMGFHAEQQSKQEFELGR